MQKIQHLSRSILQLQLPRFMVVGSIGFIVDASILLLAHLFFNLIISRIISFSVAVTCTWLLNRIFTFCSNDTNYKAEWLRYTICNTIGGAVNFSCFVLLIHHFPAFHAYPLIALILATSVSALVNFSISRHFAFKQKVTIYQP